ncbi:unnamed protein product [Sphagnum balticum]
MEFSETGDIIGEVVFVGGYLITSPEQAAKLKAYCQAELKAGRLPWNEADERKCGRPLGMRIFYKHHLTYLYFVDAYHGVFRVDITSDRPAARQIEHLVSPSMSISTPLYTDPTAKLPPRFFNCFEVLPDGRVVFTDSSYKHARAANRIELIDGAPRGRLLEYNPMTHNLRAILCGLHLPNGVQLLPTTYSTDLSRNTEGIDSLMVVELTRFRVLRVHLNMLSNDVQTLCREGSPVDNYLNTHVTEEKLRKNRTVIAHAIRREVCDMRLALMIFTEGLPGVPDNIKLSEVVSHGGRRHQHLL